MTRLNDTTQRIVEAAAALFLARGFGAVSMDQIAACAGITKITVYQHVRSKEQLLIDCLRWRLARREVALDAYLSSHPVGCPSVMAIFDWTAANAEAGSFAGCAFLKATNEMADALPEVREVAREAKRLIRVRLTSHAAATGGSDAAVKGQVCSLLLEGAQALSHVECSSAPFHVARAEAARLLASNPAKAAR